MDATTLRIVLFVLGILFLGAIYLYETRRRKRESAQARRRVTESLDPVMTTDSEPSISMESLEEIENDEFEASPVEEESPSHSAFDDEPDELGSIRIDDSPIPGIDDPVQAEPDFTPIEAEKAEESMDSGSMEQQDLFTFSAQEESPADVPDLILQINIKTRKAPFDGPAIEKAMQETGLHLSEMAIYQRLSSDGSNKVLYSIASMVEPGVFPVKEMQEFTTPGLTLFAQLPGPGDGLMIFSDMLYTAERLSAMLLGDLQDETHSALTKQTIEHMRERILEHKRQIQLARRKG
ncbi:MAG: cell division protein ZipA [Candidatus Thiodiazotropha sp. (ex Monitilora ramsayi)]|nr:cell division protein ZipA [Candidatus Thiodiazotropha sp. (ex Monitilora ramsayi)]